MSNKAIQLNLLFRTTTQNMSSLQIIQPPVNSALGYMFVTLACNLPITGPLSLLPKSLMSKDHKCYFLLLFSRASTKFTFDTTMQSYPSYCSLGVLRAKTALYCFLGVLWKSEYSRSPLKTDRVSIFH